MIAFFRQPKNLPILIIPLLLLLWSRFVAPNLGESSFTNVALFPSPYLGELPLGEPGTPVTPHVVIIVVDGLSDDISRQLPALNDLRAQGADRVAAVGQPSFSLPGWTVIGTGAWQEQSGITTNYFEGVISLDTIFQEAKRAGLTTAIVGSQSWGQLYPTAVDTIHLLEELPDKYSNVDADLAFDQDTADLALDVLQNQPNLLLVHLLSTDSGGHGWGGSSPQYMQLAQNADTQIARILAAIDLSDTAVFVTADHGHIDRGGHGGAEDVVLRVPLVSAGQGIKPGQYPDAHQADIASTVAVLLGAAIPAHNQGDILLDQLDMPEADQAARAVDLAAQIAQRYDSMLQTVGDWRTVDTDFLLSAQAALAAGNTGEALTQAQSQVFHARSQWGAAHAERLNRERQARLPAAIVVLVLMVAYLVWWARERWNWKAPVLGAVIYFALWYAIYFLIDRYTFSISMFNKEDEVRSFITGRVIEALVALLVAVVVVAILRRRAEYGEIARDTVHTMLLVALALAVQIDIFYVQWGFFPDWYLPEMNSAFKFYLDLYQTTVFWPLTPVPTALLLPFIALGVAWLAKRLLPPK
jgi:hypothetical protein